MSLFVLGQRAALTLSQNLRVDLAASQHSAEKKLNYASYLVHLLKDLLTFPGKSPKTNATII